MQGHAEQAGFSVEHGIGGLETAFRASWSSGPGPDIAILCEYDALAGIGHGCGHNLIAAMGYAAGAALKQVHGAVRGTLSVIGCPGEEGQGGKILMIDAGVFKNIDAAVMMHPFDFSASRFDALGVVQQSVEFFGKPAHSACAPHEGRNALDAMILLFNAMYGIRTHSREDSRLHGIITHGGTAPNVVPDYTRGEFYIRSLDTQYMNELKKRFDAAARGAAKATGTRARIRVKGKPYEPVLNLDLLSGRMEEYFRELGIPADIPENVRSGSTDFGNLSQILPAIHGIIQTAPAGTAIHTNEFRESTLLTSATRGMINGAVIMAWMVLDLFHDSKHLKNVKKEFRLKKS